MTFDRLPLSSRLACPDDLQDATEADRRAGDRDAPVLAVRENGRNFAAGRTPRKKEPDRNYESEIGLRGKPPADAHRTKVPGA